MRALLLFGLLLMFCLAPAQAQDQTDGPSYDCREARTPDERTVCGSPELSSLDRLLAEAYKDFEPEFAKKRDIARGVLADRGACMDDEACIAAVYANALSTYMGMAAPHWPSRYAEALLMRKAETQVTSAGSEMPAQIGQCASSTITQLTDRFGAPPQAGDDHSGSAVVLANGGYQVSYEREEGLALSEVHDRVTICLIERPRDCPQGDDRGRMYLTLNEDKHVTWLLPDGVHQCGGA